MTKDAERVDQAHALLASDRVTPPTRRALQARLDWRPGAPQALDAEALATLRAVAARLVPIPGIDLYLAERLDARLAAEPGDGWRYADMPADRIAVAQGLQALEWDASSAHGRSFALIGNEAQDALLATAQAGAANWLLPSARWFEEVLAAMVELAYAHPVVQLDIGYDGMADARGFQDVGLRG